MSGAVHDYIIVGGGSAGCVLARRLSDDPDASVCLLEAGKPDKSPLIHMPAGFSVTVPQPVSNWAFETVPQPGLNGRQGYQPRGKTLGGSSSINAMVYIRGHRSDYDHWAGLGNPDWSYDDVLPYFKRAQNQERGEGAYHGSGGPLNVMDILEPNPLANAFVEAGTQAQLPHNDDFNGETQEGVGLYQVTQKDGERMSAAKAYLTPVLSRPNLSVVTRAQATRVLLDGRRATGIEYRRGRTSHTVLARKAIILCGGAFQSPQLLMLSGIGPAPELKRHNIPVAHDLPGVGQNLQDHIDYVGVYKTKSRDALGISLAGIGDVMKGLWDWRRRRRGRMTSNLAEAGGFVCSSPEVQVPDLQLHFVVGGVEDHGRAYGLGHAYSCHVCVLRPKSAGQVTLAGPDPLLPPVIDPKFLSDDRDLDLLVTGYKIVRRILDGPALAPYGGVDNATPETDDQIRDTIRDRADTVYHPVGTCKMGPASDPMAVVDAQLRVRGIDGLRVVDASIMPTLIGGNTNAPTIMIAEKASDLIRNVT
jgi:choline dehydrogenase-like flavoprotein